VLAEQLAVDLADRVEFLACGGERFGELERRASESSTRALRASRTASDTRSSSGSASGRSCGETRSTSSPS
jgi:hypothetical protein